MLEMHILRVIHKRGEKGAVSRDSNTPNNKFFRTKNTWKSPSKRTYIQCFTYIIYAGLVYSWRTEIGGGGEKCRYMARSEGRERTEYKRHIDWIIHLQTKGDIKSSASCFPYESPHRSRLFSSQWQRKPREQSEDRTVTDQVEPTSTRRDENEVTFVFSALKMWETASSGVSRRQANDIRQT